MNATPGITDHAARILIVDDERQNRQLLEAMLTPEGYRFLTAASGEEALALVAQQPPDLILLDLMMPGMDGCQVAGKLKGDRATSSIPVILITARDDRSVKMLGLSAGAEDFLTKPVDRAELCVRVRNLLRLKAYGDFHDTYSQMLEGEIGSRTAALVASERLYRSTFDAAPVGIAHVSLDGEWLQVNQRLCDLLGYAREELQGIAGEELLQSEAGPGDTEAFRQMAAGTLDRYVIDEKRYRRRDGSVMWARVNVSVHRDSVGQAHFISVIEDITERRRLEAHVIEAQRMEGIGQLAAGVAHDFNNLLAVIIGYNDLLTADLDPASPLQEHTEEIRHASERAVGLTRQLLVFSRKQTVQPVVLDLNDVVNDMDRLLRRLIDENIDIAIVPGSPIGHIKADAGYVGQVLMNLVVNARDAMPNGGRLTVATTNSTLDDQDARTAPGSGPREYVVLSVSDTGTGMTDEVKAHLFEALFTTKQEGKGTGLGLATCHTIVQQSGGHISVTSEVGTGTTFKVYFPRVDQLQTLATVPVQSGSIPRGTETILVVEDEPSVRQLARSVLEAQGYSVLAASNGQDALHVASAHTGAPIRLVVTDVIMPVMGGTVMAQWLKTTYPDVKILFTSGYADDALAHHGVLEPDLAFLPKPYTPAVLSHTVRELLDRAD